MFWRIVVTEVFLCCLTMKVEAPRSLRMLGEPLTQWHRVTKPEDLNLWQYWCKNLKSCKLIVLFLPMQGLKEGEWAVENAMKINPSKSKAVRFTRAQVKDPLDYSLANTLIPEASSCKYLGIILRSYLSWADHVNYMLKKVWKALHFTMWILKKGNSNTKINFRFSPCILTVSHFY